MVFKLCLEQVGISIVVWINVQYAYVTCFNPFCRNRDELGTQRSWFCWWHAIQIHGFQSLHNSFVEVSDESRRPNQEYNSVPDDFWQSIPAKAIVHVIEDAFLATTKIVEFHNVSCTRLVIVSQYTSVGIFAFPNVKVSIFALSLYDKTIRFSFPFSTRMEFNSNSIPLISTVFHPVKARNRRRKSICWHEYKNACNEPLPYLRFSSEHEPQSMQASIYILDASSRLKILSKVSFGWKRTRLCCRLYFSIPTIMSLMTGHTWL